MKTKLTLLLAILIIGCSKEDDNDCGCETVLDRDGVELFKVVPLCETIGYQIDYNKGIPIVINKSAEQLQADGRRYGCR